MNETEELREAHGADAAATPVASGSELEDPRFTQAVEEYRALLAAGRRTTHKEFLARYPDIAPALAECLDALDFLHHAVPQLQESAAEGRDLAWAGSLQPGLPLGDFQLLREVGRGGMGVVYEAQQLSLGRRVALKVLPMLAALDAKQLQRFKNEAQAAAALHHGNIVPVYGVGCERGVHYYAMQFIDGQTLAGMIQQLRHQAGLDADVPGPPSQGTADAAASTSPIVKASSSEKSTRDPAYVRSIAQVGLQAAEALDHAHQTGVVHRDIKPANLLLDGRGHVWIADFGLAKFHDDAKLTGTGDLVGTLRYMSPEQALGGQTTIDHRTDIYSLGVTLYELLTLEPAIVGKDRPEMLRRIAFEEPPRLRQLNKAAPAELETIVLKAMAKETSERYATARDLADDLGRFLDDRPILARRPTLVQRLRRWSRRHRAVVVTGTIALALLLVLALIGLSANNILLTYEQEQTKAALDKATRAEHAENEARRKAERSLYFQSIARADLEGLINNFLQAEQILDGCPSEYRHWEWRYLKRLCQSGIFTLRGHTDWIHSITFSPDGRHLASGSYDKTVKIWDLTTGKATMTLQGHKDRIMMVVFSPDGRWLASCAGDWQVPQPGEIKVWDTRTGQEILNLQGHSRSVEGLAFSPGGEHLAAASGSSVMMWDALTGKLVLPFRTQSTVHSVAFSPDGQRLAAALHDKTVKVWDVKTRKEVLTLRGHLTDVRVVVFSPDGYQLASTSYEGGVKVWDTRTGQETCTLAGHHRPVSTLTFSPDGNRLASASSDGSVKIWNATFGKELFNFRGHTGEVYGVAFSPGGYCLASVGWDRTVKVWEAKGEELNPSVPPGTDWFSNMAFRPDGHTLAVTSMRVATRGVPGYVRVWEARTGRLLFTLADRLGGFNAVAFSPDGKSLATDWDTMVKTWDLLTKKKVFTLAGHEGAITNVAYSPDKERLASASVDKTVKPWEATSGRELLTLVGHDDVVTSVAFSPKGERLASASRDRMVRIWEVNTGREIRALRGHSGAVTDVAFHPTDGDQIASASADGSVKVWDLATGREILALPEHIGAVTSVAYHPHGHRLVSASADGSIRIWDTTSGQEALTLRRQFGYGHLVGFSPDGQRLAAMELQRRTLKIWDAEERSQEAQQQRVCAWHTEEARGCEGHGQWLAATFHLGRLIDAQKEKGPLYTRRALAHLKLAQWDEAAADAAHALDLGVDGIGLERVGWQLAWLRLHFGDEDEQCRLRAALLERHAKTTKPWTAFQAARLCVLNPPGAKDPAQPVALAKRAVETMPQNAIFWDTLALAHYRAKDWKEALAACKKATGLQQFSASTRERSFLLAMVHWQMGDKAQALKNYQQGVDWLVKNPDWLKKNRTDAEELGRFRAEAATLLGILEPPLPALEKM